MQKVIKVLRKETKEQNEATTALMYFWTIQMIFLLEPEQNAYQGVWTRVMRTRSRTGAAVLKDHLKGDLDDLVILLEDSFFTCEKKTLNLVFIASKKQGIFCANNDFRPQTCLDIASCDDAQNSAKNKYETVTLPKDTAKLSTTCSKPPNW